MRSFISRLLLAAAVFLAWLLPQAAQQADARPGGFHFTSGNWQGRAYYSSNGRFTECIMSARYSKGDILMFSIRRNATMTIGVGNQHWNLSVGRTSPVNLYVDGILVHRATGVAVSRRVYAIPFRTNKVGFALLRKGRNLVIQTRKGRSGYSLQGTNRALVRLLACAVAAMKRERAGSESIFQ